MSDEVVKETVKNASHDGNGKFCRGNKASPGRPKGSHNSLTELASMIRRAIYTSWREVDGRRLLRELAAQSPREYLKLVASTLPKFSEDEAVQPAGFTRSDMLAMLCPPRLPAATEAIPQSLDDLNVPAKSWHLRPRPVPEASPSPPPEPPATPPEAVASPPRPAYLKAPATTPDEPPFMSARLRQLMDS